MSILASIFKPMPAVDAYPNRLWSERHDKYETWMRYYSGEVLRDTEESDGSDPVRKFPLGINLCRQMVKINAYALLGDWNDRVFSWKKVTGKPNQTTLDYLESIFTLSLMNSNHIRQTLSHTILGGMVWKIHTYPDGRLRWIPVDPVTFFPVFSSMDGELIEMILSFQMNGREAALRWPQVIKSDEETLIYQEHWTKREKVVTVGEHVVERRPAIDGIIPYVYTPRISATGESYGESLVDGIMGLQDETNFRLADMGDAINRETHRKLILSNLPGGLMGIKSSDDYVDLGMGVGRANPEVHSYNGSAIPAGSLETVRFVLDFARYEANTPPVSFGEDEGSQRSSLTLVTRMWPLVRSAQANRAFIADGFTQLAEKTLRLARKASLVDVAYSEMGLYTVDFPPILPQDRDQIINEVSTLWGGGNKPLISVERALDILNVPEADRAEEVGRIQAIHRESERLVAAGGSVNDEQQ